MECSYGKRLTTATSAPPSTRLFAHCTKIAHHTRLNLFLPTKKFDTAMAEKRRLEDDAQATQARMDSATALISALAGEEVRWTEQSKQFDLQIQRLTGDCALASSFVSYLGPFNKEFRDLLTKRDFYGDCAARGIPITENLDVTRFLVEESEIGEWNLQGLPTDELSIQNGIETC